MDRTAIRNFAIYARNKLIEDIKESTVLFGVTEGGISQYYGHLDENQLKARNSLISAINSKSMEYSEAYKSVVEDVAYIWFTRIVSLRYMELNNILPFSVSIFPNRGSVPEIVTNPYDENLIYTDEERSFLHSCQNNGELYTHLFVKVAEFVEEKMTVFAENLSHHSKMLLSLSYEADGVITRLVNTIEVSNFTDGVEILGWCHQYYNTDVFNQLYDGDMSKKKISPRYLPVATQLYTPDWVVKYMVENTLGRVWIDHLMGNNEEHKVSSFLEKWEYYIEDTDKNSPELKKIQSEKKNISPEEIKFIDPCMGSGHILVYAFELLMQIYLSKGYEQKTAVRLILEKNLYGLDIDDRACSLAFFALMMKAYRYNKDILGEKFKSNICAVQESNSITSLVDTMEYFAGDDERLREEFQYLVTVFYDAKEYGSIINMRKIDLVAVNSRIEVIKNTLPGSSQEEYYREEILTKFLPLVKQAEIMSQHYDVVVTNPPYLNNSRMSSNLSSYVAKEYNIAKNDLATVFIHKALGVLTKENGLIAMITTVSWMYIKSFEQMRKYLLQSYQFNSIVDFGTELFEGKIGHLPVVSWVNRKHRPFQKVKAVRLTEYNYSRRSEKQQQFFNGENHYISDQLDFAKIPGEPVAYWLGEGFMKAFQQGRTLGELTVARNGMKTGDNERFLRLWWEVKESTVNYNAENALDAYYSKKTYFPYNKGGEYRKWYGNNDYLIDWHNNGEVVMGKAKEDGRHTQDYNQELKFMPLATWSLITVKPAFRYKKHALSDIAGMSFYTSEDKLLYYLGFCNTSIATELIRLLAPTMNCQVGDIARLPILHSKSQEQTVIDIVKENIALSKEDWDSFETSWDFKAHPFITYNQGSLTDTYEKWAEACEERFNRLKSNEELLNSIFMDIYSLGNSYKTQVEEKDVTVRKADLSRDVRSFISYAVGCILGRYSLDKEGVVFTGDDWNKDNYKTFVPVEDNCLVITDMADYENDIVYYFTEFLKVAFGKEHLEENLLFIGNALETKGLTPQEQIRNYFFNDFYKEHLSTYTVGVSGKRPIYWMFQSGKKGGLKVLSYMHRWTYEITSDVRCTYLPLMKSYYEEKLSGFDIDPDSNLPKTELRRQMKDRDKLLSRYDEIIAYEKLLSKVEGVIFDTDMGIKYNHKRVQTTVDGEVLPILAKI